MSLKRTDKRFQFTAHQRYKYSPKWTEGRPNKSILKAFSFSLYAYYGMHFQNLIQEKQYRGSKIPPYAGFVGLFQPCMIEP